MRGDYHWRTVIRPTILARDGYRCQIRELGVCANLSGEPMSPRCLEVDHKTPVEAGGSDHPANLRASCRPCNRARAAAAIGTGNYNSRSW